MKGGQVLASGVWRILTNSEDVGRHHPERLPFIGLNSFVRVVATDVEVGVHCDENVGDVRLKMTDEFVHETPARVTQTHEHVACVIEHRQHSFSIQNVRVNENRVNCLCNTCVS